MTQRMVHVVQKNTTKMAEVLGVRLGYVQHSLTERGPGPVSAPLVPLRHKARLTEAPLQARAGRPGWPGPRTFSRRLLSSVVQRKNFCY